MACKYQTDCMCKGSRLGKVSFFSSSLPPSMTRCVDDTCCLPPILRLKTLLQPMHGWVKWTTEAGKGLFVRNDVLRALLSGVLAHVQGARNWQHVFACLCQVRMVYWCTCSSLQVLTCSRGSRMIGSSM